MSRSLGETHVVYRIGWLRAAVLGANDGLISTASLMVGIASAATSPHEVIVAGVAGLVVAVAIVLTVTLSRRRTPGGMSVEPGATLAGDGSSDPRVLRRVVMIAVAAALVAGSVLFFSAFAGMGLGYGYGLPGRVVLIGAAFVFASSLSYAFYLAGSAPMIQRLGAARFTALAMLSVAAHAVQSNWSYYVIEKFQWTPTLIGMSLAVVGFVFALAFAIQNLLWGLGQPIAGALADRFGASQGPVREALRRLGQEGLLVTQPRRGTRVRELTLAEIDDIFEVRAELESWAARRFVARRTPASCAALVEAFDVLERVGRAGDADVRPPVRRPVRRPAAPLA